MRLTPRRAHVGGELLVAEDGQALLEAELEPVAAGDAVAGPVVEILVRDDALDAGEVLHRWRCRAGQDVLGVEDVEALVLHRAHVEVADGDDVEHVEVVLAAVALLVPAHGALQRGHGVVALVAVLRLHVDAQATSRPDGGEAVLDQGQVAGDQGEQVARLGKGSSQTRGGDRRQVARCSTGLPLDSSTG
jgi:hypothetical protein